MPPTHAARFVTVAAITARRLADRAEPALKQHHRISKSGCSRSDVHGGTTSEIEAAHLVRPSGRIPGPAGDRVVDNSGPDEHEDDAREHASSLGHSTSSKSHSDGLEHSLVDGK